MPSITGIELGPDSCVLVRARQRGASVEISAFHQIDRAAWPATDTALSAALRRLRKTKRFPRRARVVAWGLSEPAREGDVFVRGLVRPLAAAGFRVERVLTLPEALAEIARTRPRGRGVAAAWLAVNVHGAAIAIVRDAALLFGRAFDWSYTTGAANPRTEMLQRYSLVSHLAPEVRRGMTLARNASGAIVETAIICGDLPDLRSLTMPLIEELDLEVETLDAMDGLVVSGRAQAERFAESAPAFRLATAAATIPAVKGRIALAPLVRMAAAVFIVAGLGYLGYRYWPAARSLWPASGRVAEAPRTAPAATRGTSPARPAQTSASTAAPAAPPPSSASPPVAKPATPVAAPASPAVTPGSPPAVRPPVPAPQTTGSPPTAKPQPTTTPAPVETKPMPAPPIMTQATKTAPATAAPPVTKTVSQQPPPPVTKTVLPPLPASSPASTTAEPERTVADPVVDPAATRADTPRRKPVPLKAPLPAVESILVASDRRVAVVDGRIVTVGDQVGPRAVAGIERDAVVLEEPSGHQIRIPIRRGRGVE